jgi:hypothetical protein
VSGWFRIDSRRRATAWAEHRRVALTEDTAPEVLQPLTLYRFIMGADSDFTVMSPSEVAELNDPMAALLKQGKFPLAVEAVLRELDASGTLPQQSSFLISEAGQIPPGQAPLLHRDMRFAIVRGQSSNADLAISTSAVGDPETVFLQVAGWDDPAGLFNYYMRISGTWVWAGNSYHALKHPSRGNGCFDSHVNGSLVMKELKQPWMNWQSENATIALADNDPLRQNALYQSLSGAENLESIVRAGISQWTASRLKHAVAADILLNSLEIPADFTPPSATGKLYADSLVRYDFALAQDDFRRRGDTFFAFIVPEASFEDIDVVNQMVSAGILTAHFVASILMVDFPNPVFSPARARLLQYVPTTATIDPAAGGLSQQIAQVISQAAQGQPADSPEAEFKTNWELADLDWKNVFATEIETYMTAVSNRISSVEGFDDYVRLAESRRREFKHMRLNEFSLTLPATNIPIDAPLLQMQRDATIHEKSDSSHQTRLRSSS